MSSSTNKNRSGFDAFYTPPEVARACVSVFGSISGATAWEPHAGSGSFVEALELSGVRYCLGSDTDTKTGWMNLDAGKVRGEGYDIIVGNPPYNHAEDHLRNLVPQAGVASGFLLRLAFWSTQTRQDFWAAHPPAEVWVLVRRPTFLERYEPTDPGGLEGAKKSTAGFFVGPLRVRVDGELVLNKKGFPKKAATDSADYAFFVWRVGHEGPPTLHHLNW